MDIERYVLRGFEDDVLKVLKDKKSCISYWTVGSWEDYDCEIFRR